MAMEILSNRGQGELGRSRARTSGGAAGAGTFEDNVGLLEGNAAARAVSGSNTDAGCRAAGGGSR